ncbi:crotonase/enoyl-CoA hydratase family protein [Methylophaga sp.]|uniref:crotonase/enoyl-CoA hydratase family protein n=1 Tax=Methylophaga sp. TaxID=2024840 RepID=UPI003F69FBC6
MNALKAHKHLSTEMQENPHVSGANQMSSHYDEKYKINWLYMHALPRPCFSHALLDEITVFIENMKNEMQQSNQSKYDYLVVASKVENVFNLGGDLDLFTQLIEQKDRAALLEYAVKGIDLVYHNHRHFDLDMTTISLIQGDALGGGFEAALSSNVIIAEKGVKMGLPEVLFNLFPGMGAYSLLSRKIGSKAAERMILSGKVYTAEEMFDLGVIDILAEPGEGDLAVYRYVDAGKRSNNTRKAMRNVLDVCNPITYEEMYAIGEIWADAALELTTKDLKMMARLIKRQTVRSETSSQKLDKKFVALTA